MLKHEFESIDLDPAVAHVEPIALTIAARDFSPRAARPRKVFQRR